MAILPLVHPSPERRTPLRLLSYWEKLRKGRLMPLESDLNPEDIRDLWDSCFLIHVKDSNPSHYRYSYVGPGIVQAYCGDMPDNDSGAEVTPQPGMIDGYRTVIRTCKPLIETGEFSNRQDKTVKYRQCLLPLGDGDEVQAILGALHFRIFSH